MYEFQAIQRNVRIHAGRDALEALPAEMRRLGASRAFLVCGRSLAQRTDIVERIGGLTGTGLVGMFHGVRKDAPVSCVEAAVAAARACQPDVILAVGAGSVIKAARVIAILMAEALPLRELCTQYLDSGEPVSPKLMAKKLPIFNILTAPTSAQNRAGSALKSDEGGARLEFFDPKTRPSTIFWDAGALLTAPQSLMRSTGFSVYWRALMNMGAISDTNPLVEGDRNHALLLARRSLFRAVATQDYRPRIDLCAAALLQNRDEDCGGRPFDAHPVARAIYALAAPLFNRYELVDQAHAHAALTAAAIREYGDRCPAVISSMGRAIMETRSTQMLVSNVADLLENDFRALGMPTRLRDLIETKPDWDEMVKQAQHNFNADRSREFLTTTEAAKLRTTLEAAW